MKKNRLLTSVSAVFAITILAKILGLVREGIQARILGTGAVADSFSLAYSSTINIFTTLFYALCVASIPVISQLLERDRNDGIKAAGNLLSITVLSSVALGGVWGLLTFTGAFSRLFGMTADGSLFNTFLIIFTLTLPVVAATYLLVALLQSMGKYAVQGALSLPYNLVIIGVLAVFGKGLSIKALALLVAIAWIFQLLVPVFFMVKDKIRLKLKPDFSAPYLKDVFKTALVTIVVTSTFLLCHNLDLVFAARKGEGLASAFSYADRLFTPLVTALSYSITAVVFPKFNKVFVAEKSNYKAYVASILQGSLMLVLPISVIVAVFSPDILKVVFEGGNFTAFSTQITGEVLAMYCLGMAGFLTLDILSKAFFAENRLKSPLFINLCILAAGLIFNMIIAPLSAGGGLLALGTSLCLIGGGIALGAVFFRGFGFSVSRIVRYAAAAGIMGGALYFVRPLVVTGQLSKAVLVLVCLGLGAAAMGLYVVLCRLFGEKSLPWKGAN